MLASMLDHADSRNVNLARTVFMALLHLQCPSNVQSPFSCLPSADSKLSKLIEMFALVLDFELPNRGELPATASICWAKNVSMPMIKSPDICVLVSNIVAGELRPSFRFDFGDFFDPFGLHFLVLQFLDASGCWSSDLFSSLTSRLLLAFHSLKLAK